MTEATQTTVKRTRTVPLAEQITKLQAARSAALATLAGIDEKLPALLEQQEREQAALTARQAIDVDGLPPGQVVTFTFGRAEKARTLTGAVKAFAPATDAMPARYAIEVGDGIDVDVLRVPARDVFLPGASI